MSPLQCFYKLNSFFNINYKYSLWRAITMVKWGLYENLKNPGQRIIGRNSEEIAENSTRTRTN